MCVFVRLVCPPSHRVVVFGGAPLGRVVVVLRGIGLPLLLLSDLDDDFPGGEKKNTNDSKLSRSITFSLHLVRYNLENVIQYMKNNIIYYSPSLSQSK